MVCEISIMIFICQKLGSVGPAKQKIKLPLPKAISTSCYSNATAFCKQICIDIGYNPFNDSTLWSNIKTP